MFIAIALSIWFVGAFVALAFCVVSGRASQAAERMAANPIAVDAETQPTQRPALNGWNIGKAAQTLVSGSQVVLKS